MTPHYLAKLLSRHCNRQLIKYGEVPDDWSDVSDEEIIDRWNNIEAYSDQEKLTPRQLNRAIARCETLRDFLRIVRCPALATGSFVMFRPGKPAMLKTLLDRRYFIPPPAVQELIDSAVDLDYDEYRAFKKIIREECRGFFRQHQVRDFDIWLTYYYRADE